jgi:hypothetical protein
MSIAFHNALLRQDGKSTAEEARHQQHLDDMSRQERTRREFIDVLSRKHAARMNISFETARQHVEQVCVTANRRRDEGAA